LTITKEFPNLFRPIWTMKRIKEHIRNKTLLSFFRIMLIARLSQLASRSSFRRETPKAPSPSKRDEPDAFHRRMRKNG
jgi:hypothetical protein